MKKAPDSWHLRDETGGRFGPVSLDTLRAWAEDGRIGPAHLLSSDGENWKPACDEPLLSMDWVAMFAGQTFYGPVARAALDGLLASGDLPKDAVFFRRSATDRTKELEEKIAELEENSRLQNEALEAGMEILKKELATAKESAESLRKDFAASEKRLATAVKDLLKTRSKLDDARQETKRLSEECKTAAKELSAVRKELDALRKQSAKEAELQRKAAEKREDDLRKENARLASELETALAQKHTEPEAEVVEVVEVISPEQEVHTEKRAKEDFRSMAALEAQLQRELGAMGNGAPDFSRLFKR